MQILTQNRASIFRLAIFCLLISTWGAHISLSPILTILCCISLAVITLLPSWRLVTLAISNLTWGLLGFLDPASRIGLVPRPAPALYAALYLVSIVGVWLFIQLTILLPRALACLTFLILGLSLVIFFHSLDEIFKYTAVIFIGGFWYSAVCVAYTSKKRQLTILEFLASQRPFFSYPLQPPAPPLLGQLATKSLTTEDQSEFQRNGIRLMTIIWACEAVRLLLVNLAKNNAVISEAIRNVVVKTQEPTNFFLFDPGVQSFFSSWFIVFGGFAAAFLKTMLILGPGVAVLQMAGFSLVSPVYDLFGARTIYQFLERYGHYYCILLMDQFVRPIHRYLNISSAYWRSQISLFFGIILCGFAFHYFAEFFFRGGVPPPLRAFAPFLIYWVLIAALTCASFSITRAIRRLEIGPVAPVVSWSASFVVLALLFIIVKDLRISPPIGYYVHTFLRLLWLG